jgi:hypothetical protein
MEEIGKRRLAAAAVAVAGLAYFLACAFPLQKELVLVPVWSRSISAAPAAPMPSASTKKGSSSGLAPGQASGSPIAASPIPFRLGDRFGYFNADGSLLFASPVAYGVALAPDAFATYDRLSESFAIKSPAGAELARVSGVGYPFFAAGRRFLIGPDQATVSELSGSGATAWTYQFPSIVTAFDASPSLAAFGLMDGTIVGLDRAGAAALNFAPGGSRVAGVYGVAVSPDGQLVAAMTGADKQRLVVLEKRSTAYRVTYHRYLASDYRRPVSMAFTVDGSRLAYESPSGVGIYDRSSRSETVVSLPADSRLGLTTMRGELMVFLSGRGEDKRLLCTALPDRRVVDLSFKAKLAFVQAEGNSLYLGLDDSIVRMDLKER